MSTPTTVIISRVKSNMKVNSNIEYNTAINLSAKEFSDKLNSVAEVAMREVMEEYHLTSEDAYLAAYEGGLETEEQIRLDFLSYLLDELVLETA